MEEWRDIPGYEGFYQVSSEGNVMSMQRLTQDAIDRGVRRAKKSLKFGMNMQGRRQVALCREGQTRRYQVHTMVLLAFVGPRPEGMEGRHMDGNHLNNRADNLEWGTHRENMLDKRRHGTACTPKKLTYHDVVAIRADTDSHRKIAVKYGVSQVTIHMVKTGKTWANM